MKATTSAARHGACLGLGLAAMGTHDEQASLLFFYYICWLVHSAKVCYLLVFEFTKLYGKFLSKISIFESFELHIIDNFVSNLQVFVQLRDCLYQDDAVTGEAAGLAMGLVMVGGMQTEAYQEMVQYVCDTQHDKIQRGLRTGIALLAYGQFCNFLHVSNNFKNICFSLSHSFITLHCILCSFV